MKTPEKKITCFLQDHMNICLEVINMYTHKCQYVLYFII